MDKSAKSPQDDWLSCEATRSTIQWRRGDTFPRHEVSLAYVQTFVDVVFFLYLFDVLWYLVDCEDSQQCELSSVPSSTSFEVDKVCPFYVHFVFIDT